MSGAPAMSDDPTTDNTNNDRRGDDPLDHLPDELQVRLAEGSDPPNALAAAPFDLDDEGMYLDGYLVLTEERLGCFSRASDSS